MYGRTQPALSLPKGPPLRAKRAVLTAPVIPELSSPARPTLRVLRATPDEFVRGYTILVLPERRHRNRNVERRGRASHAVLASIGRERAPCAVALTSRCPEHISQHPAGRSRAC